VHLHTTRISIRERSFVDVLDLALHVIRAHAWPLAAALAVGVLPTMLLNAWLLGPRLQIDPALGLPVEYMWTMLLLVLWEMPLATAPLTLYLGQAVFLGRPRPGKIALDFLKSLPQLLLFQVVLRAILVVLLITWFALFAAWPYLNEVILLERNPLFRGRRGQMTTSRRTQVLHGGYVGDLFGRWLSAMAAGVLLLLSLWFSIAVLRSVLLEQGVWYESWHWGYWDRLMFTLYYPLALWLVVGYLGVVRFLAYLDLRIRREGWEVELLMRAEQARLRRQLT